MTAIKFIRDVAVHAIHREQGTVHEFEKPLAELLIAEGCAVAFTKPAKQQVETAESRVMAAAESAVVTTAKGKPRK